MAFDVLEPTGSGDMSGRDDAIRANFAAIQTCIGATNLAGPTALNDRVVQVVNTITGAKATGTTVLPNDDTIPQNTEGDEYMTLAITPVSATNKLKIEVVCILANGAGGYLVAALFQDTTANALAVAPMYAYADELKTITFTHYMAAGTTSATTFKVRAGGNNAATTTFNGFGTNRKFGGVLASSITITEIRV